VIVKLYLDTEFNGHGGPLISLALAAEDGSHWYVIMPYMCMYTDWVAEHVIPVARALPPLPLNTMEEVRFGLREFLQARAGATIYADWPDDFVHLMKLMSGPSYEDSFIVPCSMVLLKESDPRPKFPHNALSDAIALMEWHQALDTRV
jgi:hypothetical protein